MVKENRKIIRRDGMDRISKLADDLLVIILSFVPTEQAVTTSFMSQRWKSLWTLLPVIDFDYASFCKSFGIVSEDHKKERFRGFLRFVDYVFTHHQLEHIHRLRFVFDIARHKNYASNKNYASDVRRLFRFAMLRNCSTLHLEISNLVKPCLYPTYHGMYTLPPCKTFPDQSVTQLKLTNCKLTISKRNIFLSVKIAKLTVVELRKDSVYNLVSKCPCLEELHLIRCKLPSSSFKLNSPKSNFKCLVLHYCICSALPLHVGTLRHVAVNIPSLLQFKCEGISCYPTINNADNLTEAKIRILNTRENDHELLCKLLQNLRNVEVLALCYQNLEVLGANGGRSLLTPLNLKHLAITLRWVEKDLPNLMCLLRNSPYIEALSLDLHRMYEGAEGMISSVYNEDEFTILEPLLLPSDCVMHLTKIEIKNFQGLKVEMEFVKIMLKSSLCLKEMVIFISSRYELLKQRIGEEHNEVLQKKKDAAVEKVLACTCKSPGAHCSNINLLGEVLLGGDINWS